MNKQNNPWFYTLYIMLFAGIGGMLYGYDIGVISGALPFMQREIGLSTIQLSMIVAAVLGGGSIATLVSGSLSDRFGRKKLIITAACIFITGVMCLIFADTFYGVLFGRIIQGIGVGIVTIVVPLYLVETVPHQYRGRSIAIFQCFLTAGILLASVVDLKFLENGDWRIMFACALVPGVLLLLGTYKLCESPRWLFTQGKELETKKALLYCNDQVAVEKELLEMKALQRQHVVKTHFSQKQYRIPFLIALAIACLNQMTGINSLLQFSTFIIMKSGLTSVMVSMLGTLGITLLNFLTTILAFFLIDKVGRRPLMLIGTAGITLSLIFLAAVSFFIPVSALQGYLTIVGMLFYIVAFAIGPGVIVWLCLSEILPTPIRGNGMAVCLFANSLTSTLLAGVFLEIAHVLGYAGNFILCGIATLFYFILIYRFLPESNQKTLEEIEQTFAN
jgi:SP family galactose:H+ symporter-like MFS transporter